MSYRFLSTILGIDANFTGKLGVGTTTPFSKLTVSGAATGEISSEDTTSTGSFVRILGDISSQNLINWQSGTALRFATSDKLYGSFTEAMRITATGKVGIGTTNPQSELDIYAASNPAIILRDSSAIARILPYAGNVYFQTAQAFSSGSTADLYFTGMYGTPVNMLIKATGNVLIGTTTDAGYKLDVNGTGRFSNTLYANSNIVFSGFIQPSSNVGYGVKSANGTVLQEWYDGSTYNYGTLVNSGNINAGNTSSGAQINVYASSYGNNGLFNAYGTDNAIKLQMGALGTNEGFLYTGAGNKLTFYSGGSLSLTLASSGAATLNSLAGSGTRMVVADSSGTLSTQSIPTGTVTGSGTTNYVSKWSSSTAIGNSLIYDNGTNVGINTASPGTLLQVKGNGVNMISLQYAADGGSAGYGFYNSSGTELWSIGGGRFVAQDALEISRQGSLKFLINSAGNVGIGTIAPSNKLDVIGTSYISSDLYLGQNHGIFFNGSAVYNVGLYSSGSDLIVQTSNVVRTVITSGGNFLIGTTTDNGLKLQVNGVTQSTSFIDSSLSRITNPGGGIRTTYNSTETGSIKIKLPDAVFNSSTMMYFTVKIYQYSTGQSYELQIGGYNFGGGGWYNVFATNLTDAGHELKVRWGYDGTSNCIWIGETTDSWSYPQVWVTDFQAGFYYTGNNWAQGWHITFETSFDTVEIQRTAAQVITSNSIGTYGITGSGTTNYLPKFTGATSVGNSSIYNNGGNVGIGTTTPGAIFDVAGALSNGRSIIRVTNIDTSNYITIGAGIPGVSNSGMNFTLDGTSKMVIASTGNLGVGTTTPDSKLVVAGSLGSTVGVGGSTIKIIDTDTGNYASITAGITGYTNDGMQFSTDGVARAVISGTGNFGIGTTTPGTRLQIDDYSAPTIRFNATDVAGGAGSIQFYNQNTQYWNLTTISGSNNFGLFNNGGTNTFDLYIPHNTGNVLINTTSDAGFKLDVNGNAIVRSNLSVNTTYNSFAANIAGTTYIIGAPVWVNDGYGYSNANNPGTGFLPYSDGTLVFNSASSEKMRIAASGNVGIGVTNPDRLLVVNGKGRFQNVGITGTPYWNNNSFELQSQGGQTIALEFHRSGYSSATIFSDDGSLAFNTNSGVERMRIVVSTGNVLIGTTFDAGYKLNVNGDGRFNGSVITTSAVTTNQTGGQLAYQGSSVTLLGAWGANSSTRGILSFYLTDSNGTIGNEYARLTDSSYYVVPTTTLNSLSGSGTRMVVADSSGTLSTQAIPGGVVKAYGSWQTNSTQTSPANNFPTPIYYNTVDFNNNVIIDNDSALQYTLIKMQVDGKFNIQFSAQFQNTDSQIQDVTIWLRKNGESTPFDVANSAGLVSIPNSHGGAPGTVIAAWNYFVDASAGDFFQLVWQTTLASRVTMQYYTPGNPPPGAASIILTVNKID